MAVRASAGRGGLSYALADFLAEYKDGFPEEQRWGLYLAQVVARVILGAVIGAATLASGEFAAFASGLAGPQALVALGAKFSRRKSRTGGKEALINVGAHPNPKQQTRPRPNSRALHASDSGRPVTVRR